MKQPEPKKEVRQDFIPKVSVKGSEARKKPRLEAILFCDYANRTQEGKLMLIGCFENMYFSPDDPKVALPFFLYVRTAETTEGELQIAVIDPNEKVIIAFQFNTGELSFDRTKPSNVEFLQKVRFPVPTEGYYWIDVSYLGESLGGSPLTIEFLKEEAKKDEHESGNIEKEQA